MPTATARVHSGEGIHRACTSTTAGAAFALTTRSCQLERAPGGKIADGFGANSALFAHGEPPRS